MGVDMYFYDIKETRIKNKSHWKKLESTMTLPTPDELLQWANESQIHVYIKYFGNYEETLWKIRIWDMPPDKSYEFESISLNEICNFLHEKLKEL